MKKHPLNHFNFCPSCGSSNWIIHDFKSKRCLDCAFVYYANASAAVACFIQNENGDLLVCRRAHEPKAGTLDLPGGFVDMHETAQEALNREIKEELMLEIESAELFATIPNEYVYSGMVIHTLDLLYVAHVKKPMNLKVGDDVSEAFFVPVNTISPDDFGLDSIKKGIIAFLKSQHR
jgi:mutator protein MutT